MASSTKATLFAAGDAHPGDRVARFMELRGRKIIQACSALWHEVEGGFLMSLPYETPLNPSPEELSQMLVETRALGARFPSLAWV
jgi:hypothetical protein